MSQLGGPDGYRESRARLFGTGWPVAADYRIEEGLVVPLDGAGRRVAPDALDQFYMPLARPELPAEFGKLSGGGEEDVLRFVRRYGLPGYRHALTLFEENMLRRAQGIPGYDPVIDTGYDLRLRGDPVAWILAHADAIQFVGALTASLDAPDALRRLLEQRIVDVDDGSGEELRFVRAIRGRTRPKEGRLPAPDAKSRRATALGIIALCLTDNLGGIARTIQIDGARLVSILRPNNLLDSIYWLLADAVTGRQLRVCEECSHFFAATDDRMKYCPPPMGLNGPSRCMHRAKVRRWRKGQQDGTRRRNGRRAQRRPR